MLKVITNFLQEFLNSQDWNQYLGHSQVLVDLLKCLVFQINPKQSWAQGGVET